VTLFLVPALYTIANDLRGMRGRVRLPGRRPRKESDVPVSQAARAATPDPAH
jgi:hypothetical protein